MAGRGKALALFGVVGVVLLARPGRARAMTKTKTEARLSPHFMLSEFLRSSAVPEVAYYKPTAAELSYVRRLAMLVLEPVRTAHGVVRISGSMRPESVRNAKGQTFFEALTAAGYAPAEHSDHSLFIGTDFQLPGADLETYSAVYRELQRNPNVRQVILYLKTGDNGRRFVDHVHVSVAVPGLPTLPSERYAYLTLDGQRVSEAFA